MKTKIKTIHEEEYSDKSRILGILYCYSLENNEHESLVYVFRKDNYIFFHTIIDMMDYVLYGENKNRVYLTENEFDKFYDSEYIDDWFSKKIGL